MSKPIQVTIAKFPASNQVKVSFKEGKDNWHEIFSGPQYEAIREAILADADIDGLLTKKSGTVQG